MITIRISGIIASWEMESEENVTPSTLQKSLDDANGDDVLILINSPGGSVFQGLEMFSMIQNHPGHTETRAVSLAASMGSILTMAGNKKSVESTAMFFIHNAQGVGFGDFREMEKAAKWLKDVSSLLAEMYEKHTTLTLEKAQKLMNEDTQFFGSALAELGFEVIDAGEPVNQATARVQAMARIKDCEAKLSDKDRFDDLEKTAASIASKTKPNNQIKPAPNAGNENNEEEIISVKNLEELKAQFPDVYALAIQAGIDQEKDRVTAHITMGEAGNCQDLAVKNIKDGNVMTATVQAEYMAEGMKKHDISERNEDDPPVVEGQETEETEADLQEYEAALGKGMRGKKK